MHWWFEFKAAFVEQVKQLKEEDPEHVTQVKSHEEHWVPVQ